MYEKAAAAPQAGGAGGALSGAVINEGGMSRDAFTRLIRQLQADVLTMQIRTHTHTNKQTNEQTK
jgi:hypothetical protein